MSLGGSSSWSLMASRFGTSAGGELVAGALGPRPPIAVKDRSRQYEQLSQTPNIGFFFYNLVIITLIVRPAELIADLKDLPLYEISILFALLFAGPRLGQPFHPDRLRKHPIVACVAAVFGFAIFSHFTHFYLSGVKDALLDFGKVILFYAMTIAYLDTPRRLVATLASYAISASVMICLCTMDYLGWARIRTLEQLKQMEIDNDGNIIYAVTRLRGTGIFNDPNDLAMLIVLIGIISVGFLAHRKAGILRLFWLLPITICGVALICSHSRGGLLSAGAAIMILALARFGRKTMIATGILLCCGLAALAGRQANFDIEDGGTAHERIELWREGLEALKSADLLFGTGQNTYGDYAGLVAHNSYIHAFVELGIIGGTMYLGCFLMPALALFRTRRWKPERFHDLLRHWRPFLAAALAGWCVAMFSLSRCYVPPTYLLVGILTSYVYQIEHRGKRRWQLVAWNKEDIKILVLTSMGLFISVWLFVKIFAG